METLGADVLATLYGGSSDPSSAGGASWNSDRSRQGERGLAKQARPCEKFTYT